jgi:hypothetical protein
VALIELDLSRRSIPPWTPTPGGAHGKLVPSPHWVYLQVPSKTVIRWPDACACCLGPTSVYIDLAVGGSKKHWKARCVPLCAECGEHQEIPLTRYRSHSADNVLFVSLGIILLVAFQVGASAFGLLLFSVVVGWFAHQVIGFLGALRLRAGRHCWTSFSTTDDVAGEKIIQVMDSCVIWQAVVTFEVRGGIVLGFGNKKYSVEFEHLNSATRYRSGLPALVEF